MGAHLRPMTTAVKICGLTSSATLEVALDGGAAFVGLVFFARSPRNLAPIHAAALADQARGRAKVVAVTVDADDVLLTEIALIVKPDLIQLHGSETPARAERARLLTGAGIIKALAIAGPDDLAAAADWEPFVDYLMFDAKPPEGAVLPGGVGARFDWTMLAGHAFQRPWFLAGGLNPGNVAHAIAVSGAPMVDVSSGVESAAGVKDPALIAAFLSAASAS